MNRILFFGILSIFVSCGSKRPDSIASSEEIGTSEQIETTTEVQPQEVIGAEPSLVKGELEPDRSAAFSFERVQYTLDTILMDSGGALVNLQYGLSQSSLSEDKKILYALHPRLGTLYIFDLERKRLQEQIKFEKEGPNSVPPMVWNFQLLEGKFFLMSDYAKVGIFDSKAVKLENLPLDPKDFSQLSTEEEVAFFNDLKYHPSLQKIFTLPTDRDAERVSLGIYEKKTGKTHLVPLPEFGYITRFNLIYKEGINSSVSNMAELHLVLEKNKIIVHSDGTSSVYIYDIPSGWLTFRSPEHELVPKQKVPPSSRSFSSLKQFEAAYQNLLPQIVFRELIYDDSRQVYFRFGTMLKSNQDLDPSSDQRVFLFAYDEDFNLLGETELMELNKAPSFPFFKDGKLWSYVNVEDELGFVVMDFKF